MSNDTMLPPLTVEDACRHIGQLVIEKQMLNQVCDELRTFNGQLAEANGRLISQLTVLEERVKCLEDELWTDVRSD